MKRRMRRRTRSAHGRKSVLQGQLQRHRGRLPSIGFVRRTTPAGLALALLLALVFAPTAVASPLIELREDGSTVVREDRFVPPADDVSCRQLRQRRRWRALLGRAAAAKPTVRGELLRMLTAGEIDQATHDADRAIYVNALALRSKLQGARRVALGAVLRNLENVAAAGGLTPTRLPALFETVARNRQWWANGPLLRNGASASSFEGSRLVWQHYAGEGLQIQWLGTFGKANGLWQGGYDASLRALLDEALRARRAARRRDRLGVPVPLRRRRAAVGQRARAGHRACRRSRARPCGSASRATSRPPARRWGSSASRRRAASASRHRPARTT